MNLNRTITLLKKVDKEDDCFMKASPRDRIAFMWDLTAEIWSLKGNECAKQRLQRNVTKLIKNKLASGRPKDRLDVEYLQKTPQ